MNDSSQQQIRLILDDVYRSESPRILATLIRLLGDFDLAEDALHDAFSAALQQWQADGVPANPRAWLISAGRFKAIDQLRRASRADMPLEPLEETMPASADAISQPEQAASEDDALQDDRLRLIFTCCHPDLPPEGRVALTLREVCGLTTEEIAHAFLTTPTTLAQRIVRAKARIREAHIPYQVPSLDEMPARLEAVLQVIYLVFNEGYFASAGDSLMRPDLSGEAIRLGRLLMELLPQPEVMGLLALMLLNESRRAARLTSNGDIVLLEDQDRSLWDRKLITEGVALVERAASSLRFGPYTLQAAIAAVHAEALDVSSTDWAQIVALYTQLLRFNPSPVIELNRAVAVAMLQGPQAGLKQIDAILERGELSDYHLVHTARAELFRRLGDKAQARAAYERALALVQQEPERRFLERQLRELKS